MNSIGQDLRFALRQIAGAPFFTATVVMILALGIAMNTVLFTIVHGITTQSAAGIPAGNALVQLNIPHERPRETLLLGTLGAAVSILILLISCTNVGALLLGRAAHRQKEIVVRLVLGAGRRRIVRQLLTEVAVTALVASVVAFLIAAWLAFAVRRLLPELPIDLTPDRSTILFGGVLALGSAVLCGLAPALHATRAAISDALKSGAGGSKPRSRLHAQFVVAQIALTQPFLVAIAFAIAAVVGRFHAPTQRDFEQRVLEVTITKAERLAMRESDEDAAERQAVRHALETVPGVAHVTTGPNGYQPFEASVATSEAAPTEALPRARQSIAIVGVREYGVGPGYFSMLRIPIQLGRDLEPGDETDDIPAVVVDSGVASALFPEGSAVGRQIALADGNRFDQLASQVKGLDASRRVHMARIVGVASVRDEAAPSVYALDTRGLYYLRLLVETRGPAVPMSTAVVQALRTFDPRLGIEHVQTLAEENAERRSEDRRILAASAAGGMLALFLASIGLYAIVAFGVAQREREIGIRIALGARAGDVVGLFFRQGIRLTAIGLAVGLPLSVVAVHGLLVLKSGVSPVDYVAVVWAVAVVMSVAAVASWLPSRRAATVDAILPLTNTD